MRDRRAYLTLGYKWFERITVIRAFCYQNGTLSVISLQRQSRNVRRRMRIIKKRKKTCIFIKRVQQIIQHRRFDKWEKLPTRVSYFEKILIYL